MDAFTANQLASLARADVRSANRTNSHMVQLKSGWATIRRDRYHYSVVAADGKLLWSGDVAGLVTFLMENYAYAAPCIGRNDTCPCQDGDMCHYQGPNAWPVPEVEA